MKYYTPELLAGFASDDLKTAKSARVALERNADDYVSALAAIRPKLPSRFAELLDRFYLHDAQVLGPSMGWDPNWLLGFPGIWAGYRLDGEKRPAEFGRHATFALMLHLDTPPHEFVVLQYRDALVEELRHHPGLVDGPTEPLEWLHDEIELVPSDSGVAYRHSILFTRGLELHLRFGDFAYATLPPLR